MTTSELLTLDLTAQIALVKAGEISANEINLRQLEWNDKVNPLVNAFIASSDHTVSSDAGSAKSLPLAGLTVAVKDNIDVSGFNTTAGMATRKHVKAEIDAFVVSKLRQAGACFSGKLNMHEGALGASNHNIHFGNCFNPHHLDYTPGGSSGGSGAAIAAAMTPLALGSDTMGSVRIPASYCGVFGFKPSRGLVSNSGSVPCGRVMDNIGPLARSARDLTLALNIMAGYNVNDASSQHVELLTDMPSKPRLLVPQDLAELHVDADIIGDFTANLDVFKDMGCELVPFSFADYNFGAARRAGLIICEADMRVFHQHDWDNHRALFSDNLQKLLAYIDTKSPMDVMKSEQFLASAELYARTLFTQGDYLLMPTTPQRAFPFSSDVPANQADLTSFANQAGLAAVSMPMPQASLESMPAGMQLVGPSGSDFQLLLLAQKWQDSSEFEYKIPRPIAECVGAM